MAASGTIHSGETLFLRRIQNLVKHLNGAYIHIFFTQKGLPRMID